MDKCYYDDASFQTTLSALRIKRCVACTAQLLDSRDGRDKCLKAVQFALKILLHYNLIHPKSRWSATASQLSASRSLLRFGTVVGVIHQLLFDPPASRQDTCMLLNDIANLVADDAYCLSKLGFVQASTGHYAAKLSSYCWLVGILYGLNRYCSALHALYHPEIYPQQRKAEVDEAAMILRIVIAKLTMDGIFCASDLWQPPHAYQIEAWTGFFGALLGIYKLWRQFTRSHQV